MCGIAGLTDNRVKDKKVVAEAMNRAILHRGPDDEGYFIDDYAGLGMRRLSIIDLSHGHQPITSYDDRFMIFFNGEVYNYKELKADLISKGQMFKTESDTEVVLRMYEVYGREMLPRLRGMFAFAIYDKEKHRLFIARDFFGIKPLYYWLEDGMVRGYSSEIKSFLSIPGFKAEVNEEAVYNYLTYQYNPLEETFFKGVYKLSPAHSMMLDLETGKYDIERYWQFGFNPDQNKNKEEAKKEILETMKDSVEHHMIADVPVGSFLSGGIDSSIIATLMQKIRGEKKIKTFTVGFDTLSEGEEAKDTSDYLETDHTEIKVHKEEYFEALSKAVWHFDEPVADPSAIGLYFLAREARKEVKVVLSGEGSDELFGGYNIYLEPFARRNIVWIPYILLKLITKIPFEFKGKNYALRASRKLKDWYIGNATIFTAEEVEEIWKGGDQKKNSLNSLYEVASKWSESTQMQYIDIHTWLIGDILAKADKMTMAHSLELRVPFLDTKVARTASSLPDSLKWGRIGGKLETKHVLREAFRNVLPESTRKRKKLGFPTPVRDWFTKDATNIYDTILKNEFIESKLDTEVIKKLIEDHTEKRKDNSRKIYLLYMLALWYNTFIKH